MQEKNLEIKEFQLTELEERLEMAAVSEQVNVYICCNCLPGSYCLPD